MVAPGEDLIADDPSVVEPVAARNPATGESDTSISSSLSFLVVCECGTDWALEAGDGWAVFEPIMLPFAEPGLLLVGAEGLPADFPRCLRTLLETGTDCFGTSGFDAAISCSKCSGTSSTRKADREVGVDSLVVPVDRDVVGDDPLDVFGIDDENKIATKIYTRMNTRMRKIDEIDTCLSFGIFFFYILLEIVK